MTETGPMRTVGVEEELLLVDTETGVPRALAEAVSARHAAEQSEEDSDPSQPGGSIDTELQQQMIETDTQATTRLADVADQIRRWRRRADDLARESGARVVALATSPLAVSPEITLKPRYEWMVKHFGLTTREQLTCGCHVHVSIDSPEEGIGVLDRIRVWLPTLLALSGNSPFWQDGDSGYDSFRSQVWNRFPTAGPNQVFGSPDAYQGLVTSMLESGVALDDGMIYFDARLSARYPTVEVRIADVCLQADDAVLLAALVRGLVDTAAREWRDGGPAPQVSAALLRLAAWRAARSGLDGDLLDPVLGRPRPAREVVADLVRYVGSALEDSGDDAYVREGLNRLLGRGNGAATQRSVLERGHDLREVVLRAADFTLD